MCILKTKQWDIFCSVVDNFGDIGVCWRLAHQLANEWGFNVNLWVDELAVFNKICSEVQVFLDQQMVYGVHVFFWSKDAFIYQPKDMADVVVEAFSCGLPEEYLRLMNACKKNIAWFNLEYLSAEKWIDDFHLLDSPHPRFALQQKFFFPGFSSASGGLLREKNLINQREIWQKDIQQQNAFWHKYGLHERKTGESRISVFCYPHAPLLSLFSALIDTEHELLVLMPSSLMRPEIAKLFNRHRVNGNDLLKCKSFSLKLMPFVNQAEYDRLLWSCDFNIVRGEDSFVRAQWAARPLLWNIYPQEENIHNKKLNAFLDRYLYCMQKTYASALYELHQQFNHDTIIDKKLVNLFVGDLSLPHEYAKTWCKRLIAQHDLTSQLVQAAKSWLQ